MAMTFEKYMALARLITEQGQMARQRKATLEEGEQQQAEAEAQKQREAQFQQFFQPQEMQMPGVPAIPPQQPVPPAGIGMQMPQQQFQSPSIPPHTMTQTPNYFEAAMRASAADPQMGQEIFGAGGMQSFAEAAQGTPSKPIKVGTSLVDPVTFKPLYTEPSKPDDTSWQFKKDEGRTREGYKGTWTYEWEYNPKTGGKRNERWTKEAEKPKGRPDYTTIQARITKNWRDQEKIHKQIEGIKRVMVAGSEEKDNEKIIVLQADLDKLSEEYEGYLQEMEGMSSGDMQKVIDTLMRLVEE